MMSCSVFACKTASQSGRPECCGLHGLQSQGRYRNIADSSLNLVTVCMVSDILCNQINWPSAAVIWVSVRTTTLSRGMPRASATM